MRKKEKEEVPYIEMSGQEKVLEWKRKVVNEAERQDKNERFIRMIWNRKYSVENLKMIYKALKSKHPFYGMPSPPWEQQKLSTT